MPGSGPHRNGAALEDEGPAALLPPRGLSRGRRLHLPDEPRRQRRPEPGVPHLGGGIQPGCDPGERGKRLVRGLTSPSHSATPEGGWLKHSGELTAAPFGGVRYGGPRTGGPRGDCRSGGERRADTAPNPRAPGCRDSGKGAGSGGDSYSQDQDAGDPGSSGSPKPVCPWGARGGWDAGVPREGDGLGAGGSADAPRPPEELRRREGRTPGSPGSQRRAPRGRAPAPGPKLGRGGRQRARARLQSPALPAAPLSASAGTCRCPGPPARPGTARRFLPRLLNGAGQRRSGPPRPDQSSGRRAGAWPAERRVIEEAPPGAGAAAGGIAPLGREKGPVSPILRGGN